MSIEARELTAVTTDTRMTDAVISSRASASSGAINSRSASRTRSAPSMISPRWLCRFVRARASRGILCVSAMRSFTSTPPASRSSDAMTSSARCMQMLDIGEPQQAGGLAHADDDERKPRLRP